MLCAKRLNINIPVLFPSQKQTNLYCISNVLCKNYVSQTSVNIGNIVKKIKQAKTPEYVPKKYCKYVVQFSVII